LGGFFRKVENIFWECSQKGILYLFINESMNEYQKEEYIFLFDNYWEDFLEKSRTFSGNVLKKGF